MLGILVFVMSLCTFVGIGARSLSTHVECLAEGAAGYAGGGNIVVYVAVIVFGLPLFGLFRRQNWLAWWQVSLGGLLVGVLGFFAIARVVHAYVLLYGGVGLVSGFLFWLVAVFHNSAMSIEHSGANYRPLMLGVRVYTFPGLMILVGLVPALNALAYAHGGLAWLALPFTFPYVLLRLWLAYFRSNPMDRPRIRRFAVVSVPVYVAVTAPLSWVATFSINSWLGTSLPWIQFWAMMLLPVSLLGLLAR